jgi:hypothetical protein
MTPWGMRLISLNANSSQFADRTSYCEAAGPLNSRRIKMKKLTMSLWLALAAAGVFAVHAMPSKHNVVMNVPYPTCPPECPLK